MASIVSYTRNNRQELERFLKFMAVGAIGALVDFGTFNLFTELVGLPREISATLSLVAAICSNFLWNRYWTYPDSRSKPIGRQFSQFFVVNVLAAFIRVPIMYVLPHPMASLVERIFALDPATAETIGNNLALAIAVGIAMFWNFFVNRFWTYSDVGGWGSAKPTIEPQTSSTEPAAAQENR